MSALQLRQGRIHSPAPASEGAVCLQIVAQRQGVATRGLMRRDSGVIFLMQKRESGRAGGRAGGRAVDEWVGGTAVYRSVSGARQPRGHSEHRHEVCHCRPLRYPDLMEGLGIVCGQMAGERSAKP